MPQENKEYPCPYCASIFKNSKSWNRHIRAKHTESIEKDWIPCEICEKKYRTPNALSTHIASVHSGNKPEPKIKDKVCQFCSNSYVKARTLYHHANQVHPDLVRENWFGCPGCNIYFPSKEIMESHRASRTECSVRDTGNNTQCEFCPKSFSRAYIYFKHASQHHSEQVSQSWFQCDECKVSFFPTEVSLKNHIFTAHKAAKHGTGPKHLCSYCPMTLSSTFQYYKHANYRHREILVREWVICEDCNNYFPTAEILQMHASSAHRKIRPESRMQCDYCPSQFTMLRRYIAHVNSKHKEEAARDWIHCDSCDHKSPNERALRFHRSALHVRLPKDPDNPRKRVCRSKKRKCPFCPRVMVSITTYLGHVNRDHADVVASKWKSCPACQYFLPDDAAVKRHYISLHGETSSSRFHTCEACNLRFWAAADYMRHGNQEHKAEIRESWHPCGYCELYMPNRQSLSRHLRSKHNVTELPKNRKPEMYSCQFCQDNFWKMSEYARHASETHHEEVAQSWESCPQCGLFYPTRYSLQRHVKIKHGLEGRRSGKSRPLPDCRCEFCSVKFESNLLLFKHCNRDHMEQIINTWKMCNDCAEFFPDETFRAEHVLACRAIKKELEDAELDFLKSRNLIRDDDDFKEDMFADHDIPMANHETSVAGTSIGMTDVRVKTETSDDHNDVQEPSLHDIDGENERPTCNVCNLSFSRFASLVSHMKTQHSNDFGFDSDYNLDFEDQMRGRPKDRYGNISASECLQLELVENEPFPPELDMLYEENAPDNMDMDDVDPAGLNNSSGNHNCEVCGKDFEKLRNLRRHKLRMHRQKDCVDCKICGKRFRLNYLLREHMRIRHQNSLEGDDCPEEFQVLVKMEKLSNIFKRLVCPFCSKLFQFEVNFIRHLRSKHSFVRKLHCKDCSQVFETSKDLRRHSVDQHPVTKQDSDDEMEEGEFSQKISRCNSESDRDSELVERYHCPECDATFGRTYAVRRHLVRQHNIDTTDTSFEKTFVKREEVGPLRCEHCDKTFPVRSKLEVHVNAVHDKIKYTCDLCSKDFSTKYYLKIHQESIHFKSQECICDTCGQNFTTIRMLNRHIAIAHLNRKNYKCEHCEKCFGDSHVLKRHIQGVHLKETSGSFACEECDKSFDYAHVLKRHVKFVHRKEKDFSCELCGATFFDKSSLRHHHEGVHMKLKPHVCEHCGNRYSEAHALKRHVNVTHSKVPSQRCELCPAAFFEKDQLKDHILSAHACKTENC